MAIALAPEQSVIDLVASRDAGSHAYTLEVIENTYASLRQVARSSQSLQQFVVPKSRSPDFGFRHYFLPQRLSWLGRQRRRSSAGHETSQGMRVRAIIVLESGKTNRTLRSM